MLLKEPLVGPQESDADSGHSHSLKLSAIQHTFLPHISVAACRAQGFPFHPTDGSTSRSLLSAVLQQEARGVQICLDTQMRQICVLKAEMAGEPHSVDAMVTEPAAQNGTARQGGAP